MYLFSIVQAFVTRLNSKEDVLLENINVSPKSKVEVNMSMSDSDSDIEVEQEVPAVIKGVYPASSYVIPPYFLLEFCALLL